MQTVRTNIPINETGTELAEAAKKFLDAGYEFWKVHARVCGMTAVKWVDSENGHMALFTRGEYREEILSECDFMQQHPDKFPPEA
jgi:hypothetical protein